MPICCIRLYIIIRKWFLLLLSLYRYILIGILRYTYTVVPQLIWLYTFDVYICRTIVYDGPNMIIRMDKNRLLIFNVNTTFNKFLRLLQVPRSHSHSNGSWPKSRINVSVYMYGLIIQILPNSPRIWARWTISFLN